MKNMVKISVLLWILMTGTSLILNAQRGKATPGFRHDTTFAMNKDSMGRGVRHMDNMVIHRNGPMVGHYNGVEHGLNRPGRMNHMNAFGGEPFGMMHQGAAPQHRSDMAFGRAGREMRHSSPGMRIMESMPGVTAKQKEELAKLNEKHREEREKLVEKHRESLQALRDDHQKKVNDLLTDEQKKWIEENAQ